MARRKKGPTKPSIDKTFYQAWLDFNMELIYAPEDGEKTLQVPHQTAHHWTMEGFGFGLPEVAPTYIASNGDPGRRVRLLKKRYVDPHLWDAGMIALQNTTKLGSNKKNLGAIAVHLNRREDDPDKMPDGGGCLISLVFSRFGYINAVQMYARASEVTKALLGDLYFAKYLVTQAIIEGELDWDPEQVLYRWSSVYGSQKTYFVPLVFQDAKGDEAFFEFTTAPWDTPWRRSLDRYFWRFTLFPERVKFPPRRRWAEAFWERSTIPRERYLEAGERLGKFEEWPYHGPRTKRFAKAPTEAQLKAQGKKGDTEE